MPYPRNSALAAPISSRQYLQVLERNASIGSWAWQPADGVMVWSSNMHRLMRVPAEFQPTIEGMLAAVHEDDRWLFQDMLVGLDPVASTPPYRVRLADGSLRWHVCHREVACQTPVRVVIAIVQDVTDATAAHRLLVQRQRSIDTVMRLLGGILWRAAPNGDLVFDNGWCELTGTTLAENAGDGWLRTIHSEDRDVARAAWRLAVDSGRSYSTTYRVRRTDGHYVRMDVKAHPHLDEHEAVVEWIGVCVPSIQAPPAAPAPVDVADAPEGPELRAARALIGLTVDELADAAGVSAATISRHEDTRQTGRIRPSKLARLKASLAELGVTFHRERAGGAFIRWDRDGGRQG